MESIHDGSRISSIISDCDFILGSARNSTDIVSSSSESLFKASFANTSTFAFLDHGITSIEVMRKVSISPFALSKYEAIMSPRAR